LHLVLHSNNFDSFSTSNDDDFFLNVSTNLMGQQLILRNISLLNTVYDIKSVEIPKELCLLNDMIKQHFASINITYTKSKHVFKSKINRNLNSRQISLETNAITKLEDHKSSTLRIPSNSILHFDKDGKLLVDKINYPWDFLKVVQKILDSEVASTKISSKTKISKTSIIEGPCIIEKGVAIDDFCKIKGPAYIGENSFIGMGSLIRNSMLERNTRVGFNCEIGKSYFAGNDKISHHNVILDTIIGQNVWFGGYSGTANVLLDRKNVRYKVGDNLIDTGTDHFGSVIGNNCCIGASVIILPGRKVSSNSMIQAGTIVKC
jgi:UDP-N-acetylglucosamine diphosphorylase / glucose-1-phosphate thymidylyltransferase / UDP-N-acetylgalactosamine diphosphorylase / glucosamine-1-phosphate N-acetyltransferase / galactosamine-1-phosphate N-acetyltransferase